MVVFQRRLLAPQIKGHYRRFRLYVREDFVECCAYCLIHELLAHGQENFELDHFRPKSLFHSLLHDFFNLYYTCHRCNHRKHDSWPNTELEAAGYRFIDYCREHFSAHFQETDDGRWHPLTNAATYTLEKLDLNRPHLVRIRALLRAIARQKGLLPIDWDKPSKAFITQLLDDFSE